MVRKKTSESGTVGRSVIQLSLAGLMLLIVSLVVVTGLLTYGLATLRFKTGDGERPAANARINATPRADIAPKEVPPWGELLANDIELEQPEEYFAFAMDTNKVTTWTFGGMSFEQVRALMLSCGLTPDQIGHALSPEFVSVTPTDTVVKPDDDLVLSLSPQMRAKLYRELAHDPANNLIRYPCLYPGQSFDTWLKETQVDAAVASLIKKLLYPRGNAQCFSDFEVLLRQVPSEPERLRLLKALSRESAVLARLRIRPDTDIDKLLGYWERGIQVKDARPLLESIERLPDGGSISILYLLPPFARERLYTFPQPSKPGDPAMDCHWSTMNFFNETPDNRFADRKYISAFVSTNYYEVAKPTLYGDIIFLLDEHDHVVHSAVYIADDIVFTKNGNSFTQPWKLMRLKDMMALFAPEPTERMVVNRNKNW